MKMARRMTGSMLALALLTGGIAPAQARPYPHGPDRWRHHHDGFGFGDAVGVATLVGAVAIVASSMSKDKRAAQPSIYDDARPDDGADIAPDDGAPNASDDRISDACAVAAREEAEAQAAGYAEIRRMDAPRATDAGYDIDGEVETRASFRDTGGSTRRFTCSMRDGRVAQVYLSRDVVMR